VAAKPQVAFCLALGRQQPPGFECAGAALNCVLREWLRSGGHANRTHLIDQAFTRLRPASLP
jgi:hypothetical protein